MTESIFGFRPVRGLETKILANPIQDGYVYFATDTGKIYLDKGEDRISLGGSGAAIYYATAAEVIHNPAYDTYTLMFADMDDQNAIPKENDLIINSNGRFFKVNWYDTASGQINCKLIAVSGTGGGSGGGDGSGGGTSEKDLQVKVDYPGKTFVFGQDYIINVTASSEIDRYLDIEYRIFDVRGTAVFEETISFNSGDTVELNIGDNVTEPGTYGVTYRITGGNSNTYERTISGLQCINLYIEPDTAGFTNYKVYSGSFAYSVRVYGAINKLLHIEVDGVALDEISLSSSDNDTTKSVTIIPSQLGLEAGVHTITAYLIMGTVKSNIIETDFIYHPADAEDTTYVLVSSYPAKAYTYDSPEVKYWVWDTAKGAGSVNSINLIVNGVTVETVSYAQQTEVGLSWNVSGLLEGDNTCVIQSGPGSRSFVIFAEKSNIFDQVTDQAVLLLDTVGRTNSTSLERRLTWEYTDIDNNVISAKLNNFNWYNNGWVNDSNGRSCLRISNDASVEIPLTLFTDESVQTGGYAIEFEFKPYNLYSYELLTSETEVTGEDEEVVINRKFNIDKASITYAQGTGENAYGFALGTQDAYFRLSDGSNVTVRYKDEEIINVAIVVNAAAQQIFIYINGVMSGVTQYSRASGKLPIYASSIKINSQFCDIDLYNIRVYNKILESKDIVQNYIASKKDLNLYNQNKLATGAEVNLTTILEYNASNPDNATIPYMIIKTKAPDILPFLKSNDDVICDMEFVNPALDRAYALGNIDVDYYLQNAPSFIATDVQLNVQGTSSQKYPRKNFKGKYLKEATSSLTVNNSNVPEDQRNLSKVSLAPGIAEKTFTWKVDYMDSAGRHNTGFCSFVKELYDKHPLDYYISGQNYHSQYRTTIYGFPVLMFHQKSNGKVEFIGRYNFNLDKSCENSLGMTLKDKHPILTDKTIKEVAECWEFANNQGGRCSFRGKSFDYGYETSTQSGMLDLINDLEPRYHVNSDAIENAFKNKDESGDNTITDKEAFDLLLGENHDGAYGNLEKVFNWLKGNYCGFDLTNEDDQTMLKEILDRTDTILETDEDYQALKTERIANFRTNFTKHFNMEYSLIYYIMTELLVQFDSRGKNMMLASWGPIEANGEYIWFPIYYDVDTQLGVNNSGVPSWEYDVEPTDEKQFSTPDSLLWNSIRVAFESEIQEKYRELRGKKLTIADLNGYYNFDETVSNSLAMKGILPIGIINADMMYKYIVPSTEGYVTDFDENKNPIMTKTTSYFYCLQGTRDLYRALFLRNRFNYYDSKWLAQAYNPEVTGNAQRWRANRYVSEIDSSLNSNLILNITPKLNQYVVVWPDDMNVITNIAQVKARAGQSVQLDLQEIYNLGANYSDQLFYFGGSDYIQEYGNLSKLYLREFQLTSPNVTAIDIGNENENYNNPQGTELANQLKATTIETNPKPMLKTYDITNLQDMEGTVILSSSPKLEVCKALGTNITNVEFAAGANLQQVYLPKSTQTLKIIEAAQLDRVVYNAEDLVDNANGLYIEDLIYNQENDGYEVTNINTLNIVGGNLNQYSYELLNKLCTTKLSMQNNQLDNDSLSINLEEVHWTPYIQLGEGAQYDDYNASELYYANNNCTFSKYVYSTKEAWLTDLTGGRVYHLNNSVNNIVKDLSLFDNLMTNNKFTNITSTTNKGLPVITGELYIDNLSGDTISEATIANVYNAAFPDLIIKAAKVEDAYRARFVYLENGAEKEIKTQRFAKTEAEHIITPPMDSSLPVPTHYDFVGWKYLDSQGNEYTVSSDYFDSNIFEFSSSFGEYVFYMEYEPHDYKITFIDKPSGYETSLYITYDTNLRTPTSEPWRSEEVNLNFEERYAFKGWTNNKDVESLVPANQLDKYLIDVTSIKANTDLTFYAVFTTENVYDVITDYKYFDFVTITEGYVDENNFNYNITGPVASIKLSSDYEIKGKITLPNVSPEGYPITYIADEGFIKNTSITHIFVQSDSQIKEIGANAFQEATCQFVELPNSLRQIKNYAFQGCAQLSISKNYDIDGNLFIGNNIYRIGDRAFNAAFRSPAIGTANYYIGGAITTLGDRALAFSDINKGTLYLGTSEKGSNLTTIDKYALAQNDGRVFKETYVYGNSNTQAVIKAAYDAGDIETDQIYYIDTP